MFDEIVPAALALLSGFLLFYAITLAICGGAVESRCLRAGYASSNTTWNYAGYCIKRIDQTDHVVPVGEVGR